MCIIAISKKGIRQPNYEEIKTMFNRNSHGAGYMVARDGKVEIHKGYMTLQEFMNGIEAENFTDDDVVVYHFRISTQAGVNREMCHPFPYTKVLYETKALDVISPIGIAHNGVIPLTTSMDKEYSDTAHFVAEYFPLVIRKNKDLRNPKALEILEELAQSKLAILDGSGYVATVGNFITEESGLMFSNSTYKDYSKPYGFTRNVGNFERTNAMFDAYYGYYNRK